MIKQQNYAGKCVANLSRQLQTRKKGFYSKNTAEPSVGCVVSTHHSVSCCKGAWKPRTLLLALLQGLYGPTPHKHQRPAQDACGADEKDHRGHPALGPAQQNNQWHARGHQDIGAAPMIVRTGDNRREICGNQPNTRDPNRGHVNFAGNAFAQAEMLPAPRHTSISPGLHFSWNRRTRSASPAKAPASR